MSEPAFIVDFDSTLVRAEALDVLADVIREREPARSEELHQVAGLTDLAMAGDLDFAQALERRLQILRPAHDDVRETARRLQSLLTPSAAVNRAFFGSDRVRVLSGGFRDWIVPVVALLSVGPERVHANTFVEAADGRLTGFDRRNPLARSGGKAEVVRSLNLQGEVVVVGDGWTDYEIRAAGAADRFYAFTEVVARPKVVSAADAVAASFDDLLRQERARR